MSNNVANTHTVPYAKHTIAYTVYEPVSGETSPSTTLVFIHGWTCASSLWLPGCLPLLENPRYRSILIDLPGHGASTAVEGTDYSTELFAHAVGTVLTECNVTSNAVLIGHSLGGTVAGFVLKFYPSLFTGIIYVDSFFALPEHYQTHEERAARRDSVRDTTAFADYWTAALYGPRTTQELRKQIDDVSQATPLHVRMAAVGSDSLPPFWKPTEVFSDVAAISMKAWSWSNVEAHPGWNRVFPKIEEEDWNEQDAGVGGNWGHFFFMEDPARFIRSVESFLQRNGLVK